MQQTCSRHCQWSLVSGQWSLVTGIPRSAPSLTWWHCLVRHALGPPRSRSLAPVLRPRETMGRSGIPGDTLLMPGMPRQVPLRSGQVSITCKAFCVACHHGGSSDSFVALRHEVRATRGGRAPLVLGGFTRPLLEGACSSATVTRLGWRPLDEWVPPWTKTNRRMLRSARRASKIIF
jgi:hypothetical protein